MTCNRQMIYIYRGDDTDWNNEQFVTVNVTSGSSSIDLSTMSAVFTLGNFTQTYSLAEGSFQVSLSSEITRQFPYGPLMGSIKILDSQHRIKTATTDIPFYVTSEVITLQNQDLVIEVPGVSINVTVGGTLDYNNLLNKPSINGVVIEGSNVAEHYNLANKTDLDAHIDDKNNPHEVTKDQVGLGNVDNTSDVNKPISTAVQNALNTKQDVISDLATIRSGASAGATAVQPSTMQAELATKQDNLSESQLSAVNSGIDSVKVAQIATNATEISSIKSKIPTQASTSNQLADKDFVNSSINSLAAFYITSDAQGDPFATRAALVAGPWYFKGELRTPTLNDYAIVTEDETHDDKTSRFMFDGIQWVWQYDLNNTTFTAEQIAAINSGITSNLVTQIGTNESAITSLQNSKQDVIGDLSTIRSGAAAGATAVQPTDVATASTVGLVKPDGTTTIVDGEGNLSAVIPSDIWTQGNLVAGTNISITQVEKPVIDNNTLVLCHFNNSKTDEISGSEISTPSYTTTYVAGRFANGITGSAKNAIIAFRNHSGRITGKYTIDLWVYPIAAMNYMCFMDSSSTALRFTLSENSFSLGSGITGTGSAITNAAYPSGVSFGLSTWHHIAYVNDDNNNKVYFFLDGKVIHNAVKTQTVGGIYQVSYQTTANQGLRIDELRVSNVARWTSDFTPYSEPYSTAGGPDKYQINNTQDISGLIPLTQKAAANGVATLNANALIPTAQLPTIDGGNANA